MSYVDIKGIVTLVCDHHCNHGHSHYPPLLCYECSLTDMIRIYLGAKQCYYKGDPCMTDSCFDRLEDKIRKIDPNNKTLLIIG